MAQTMRREPRQLGAFDEAFERSVVRTGQHRPPHTSRNDEVVVLPLLASDQTLCRLLGSKTGERTHRLFVDRDRAA